MICRPSIVVGFTVFLLDLSVQTAVGKPEPHESDERQQRKPDAVCLEPLKHHPF
jgi:hypothetical protein